ncbi:MAG: hypothetical protein ACPG4Z_04590 [Chitinophagales bacterium]
MKKYIIILALIFACSQHIHGQSFRKVGYNEVGGGIGPSFFLSDLGGNKSIGKPFISDIDLKSTRISFYAYYKRNFSDRFGLKIQGSYVGLYADDLHVGSPEFGSDQWFRYIRNLRTKVNILELHAIGEFNILPFVVGESRKRFSKKWTPYLSVGVGLFKNFTKIDPENSGNWIRAGKDGVETEDYANGNPHSKPHLNIIGGGGIKWNMGRKSRVTLDASLLYRHTFTDYLDDVSTVYNGNEYSMALDGHPDLASWTDEAVGAANYSIREGNQRGDDADKDHYFTINVGVAFRLQKQNYKCPTFK